MSRTYQNPASTSRRPPAARPPAARPPAARSPTRPVPAPSNTHRSIVGGARVPPPARATSRPVQPPRSRPNETIDDDPYHDDSTQERAPRIGDGFQVFIPSSTKREQMRMQAETEQRQYREHVERTRLHNLNEVHRLGGGEASEAEVRQRQAEQYRRGKFERLEKVHQDVLQKKQEEDREIEARKQAARLQSVLNEKKTQASQQNSMKPPRHRSEQSEGAVGWTDEAREQDRRETMSRFLNQLTQQSSNEQVYSGEKNRNQDDDDDVSKEEKLKTLRELLPNVDIKTLEYHLEVFNGNVDAVVHELLS